MQKHRRSLVKALSYRMFATLTVFGIALLYTGELASSAKIGGAAAVAKTGLYYTWERVWSNINWGMEV